MVPTFTIDVAPFTGDPAPIIEAASRDADMSYGYLLTDEHGKDPRDFLRVRISFARLENGADFPDGHHIVYAVR